MLLESKEDANDFPLNFGNFMIGVCLFKQVDYRLFRGVFTTLSVIYDGVFCENS